MKKYIYGYRKIKGGFYTEPVTSPFDKEEIVELTQRAFLNNVGSKEHEDQKECELFYFGLFDDVQGCFELENKPVFLCNFQEVTKDE